MPNKGQQPKRLFTREKNRQHTCPICELIGRDDPTYMSGIYNAIECPEHRLLGRRIRSRKAARIVRYPSGTPYCDWCGARCQPGEACTDPLCPLNCIDEYFMDVVDVDAPEVPDGPYCILAFRLQGAPPAKLIRLVNDIVSGSAILVQGGTASMTTGLCDYISMRTYRQHRTGSSIKVYVNHDGEDERNEG